MSETIMTKGWKGPTGKCDICNKNDATHWFGDTSVALCNDAQCSHINRLNWDRMIEQEERDRIDSEW